MFSVRPQRDGDAGGHTTGWGRGTELALTPLVFVGIGWGLDRLAGTTPWLTLLVATLGITGTMVKIWLGYDRDMRAQDVGKPWARGQVSTQPCATTSIHEPGRPGPGRTTRSGGAEA